MINKKRKFLFKIKRTKNAYKNLFLEIHVTHLDFIDFAPCEVTSKYGIINLTKIEIDHFDPNERYVLVSPTLF